LRLPRAERDTELLRLDLEAFFGRERPRFHPFPANARPYVDRIRERIIVGGSLAPLEGKDLEVYENARRVFYGWLDQIRGELALGRGLLCRLPDDQRRRDVVEILDPLVAKYEAALRTDFIPEIPEISRVVASSRTAIRAAASRP
jgi:hypothetical protein